MFKSLKNKFSFQLKFKDRINAANILAAALYDKLNRQERKNSYILGIPRGGVVIADIIASKLQTDNFNIIVPRKLTIAHDEETAFGAVMLDGTTYLNNELEVPSAYVEIEKQKQIQEIKRRMESYLATDRTDYLHIINDSNATVILVDDGVASGATFIVAARWLRKFYNPRRLVVATTVAPQETVELLKSEVDYVEAITKPPSSSFHYVGQYYRDFAPVADEKVIQIMKTRNLLQS